MAKHSVRQRRLQISRLDKVFQRLRSADAALWTPPGGGWVRAIRSALGMSTTQLARRLGVSRAAVYQLQDRETNRSVTLKQLDKAANALNCDVVYALVPRDTLEQTLRERARSKVTAQLRAVNLSMGLEAEGVQGEDFDMAVTAASSYGEVLTDRHLWDD